MEVSASDQKTNGAYFASSHDRDEYAALRRLLFRCTCNGTQQVIHHFRLHPLDFQAVAAGHQLELPWRSLLADLLKKVLQVLDTLTHNVELLTVLNHVS